jgi:hypothetical protein
MNSDVYESPFSCEDCLAENRIDCICHIIIGRDAMTGSPIVDEDETEDALEWNLFWE